MNTNVRLQNMPPPNTLTLFSTAPGRVALPVAEARLRVGSFDERHKVSANDQAVVFTATLPAGRTKLQTWFLDAAGKEIAGAYYVYVERK